MSSIIPGILVSGKANSAEPDARTEPPTATARAHKPVAAAMTAALVIGGVLPARDDRRVLVRLDHAPGFPIFTVLNDPPQGQQGALVDLGWPHVSVATLRKAFNA